jgi:hypothetical protein
VRPPAGLPGAVGQLGPAAHPQQHLPWIGAGQVGRRLGEDPGKDAAADIARRIEAAAEAPRDVVAVQQGLVAAKAGEPFRVGHAVRMIGADVRGRGAHHRGQDAPPGHGELQHLGGRGILLGGGDGPHVPPGGVDGQLPGVRQQGVADVLGGMPAVPFQVSRAHRPVPVGDGQQAAHHARDRGVKVIGGDCHGVFEPNRPDVPSTSGSRRLAAVLTVA